MAQSPYSEDGTNGDVSHDDSQSSQDGRPGAPRRITGSDPVFGLLLVGAISVGLIPLIGTDAADMRYTLVWGLMALFGVLSWLLGSGARIGHETPEHLGWGVIFALIVGLPLLGFAGSTLAEITQLMFPAMLAGTLLAYLVFVMPLAETLFFRGMFQQGRTFWATGLTCTVWSVVLFFPLINRGPYPLIVAVILLMANMMYSYVRERNGLAAAWICQIVVNFLVFFIPFAGG
jgi:membrane protease YdiL (CAAX protease family)